MRCSPPLVDLPIHAHLPALDISAVYKSEPSEVNKQIPNGPRRHQSYNMAQLWSTLKDQYFSRQAKASRVKTPRMATLAMEVLAENREEAKDLVYYDALKRVTESSKDNQSSDTGPAEKEDPNNAALDTGSAEDQNHLGLEFIPSSWKSLCRKTLALTLKGRNLFLDPECTTYYIWMGAMTVAVFYNFWAIILRIAFLEVRTQPFCSVLWPVDMVTDVMYLSDIWLQIRKAYRDDQGIMINDPKKMALNYTSNLVFVTDVLSIIPSETIGLLLSGDHSPFFRLPRLFKWQCIVEFFEVSDLRTSKPNRLRASKLTLYLGMAIHWVACVYYMISEYEGLGSNSWVYPAPTGKDGKFSRKYIKSLYWSILTLTTIGETPEPSTNLEHVFTSFMFLLGIFVFAAVVGNVGDVISNMNAARTDFQVKMDYIKWFMEHHGVPVSVQERAKKWSYYAWSRAHAFHEGDAMDILPQRLRAEIAIHVHLATLKKVKIFKDCDEGLLCELVLKLRPQIFSPGDYICRCREIGREMYIINRGKVEIIVPDATTGEQVVVACLAEGNYFGEISLLKLDGGRNRRSADVRSVGYSELLCLSQRDLMEALEEYPDAKAVLEAQGRDRLQRTKSEALKLPGSRADKKEELRINFAREIKEIQDAIEELRKAHQLECAKQITKEQSSENIQSANRIQKLDELQERVSALSTTSEEEASSENITRNDNNDNDSVSDSRTIQSCRLTSQAVTQSNCTNQSAIRYRNRQSAEKLLTKILRVAQEAASRRNEETPNPVNCNTKKREETKLLSERNDRLPSVSSLHRDNGLAAENGDQHRVIPAPSSSKNGNVILRTKVCVTPKITLDNDIDGHCCLQPHRRYSVSLPVEAKENGIISCNNSQCSHYHQK